MPEDAEVFPCIKSLICGYMKLTWKNVIRISEFFPELEEFRIPYNLIVELDLRINHCFKYIKLLDLEGNTIKEWHEVNKLGILSTLEKLIVTNTSISRIYFTTPSKSRKTDIFSNLKHIVLSENLIDNVSIKYVYFYIFYAKGAKQQLQNNKILIIVTFGNRFK